MSECPLLCSGEYKRNVQKVVESGSRILTLKKVEPTLEDVFIELVGHSIESGEAS